LQDKDLPVTVGGDGHGRARSTVTKTVTANPLKNNDGDGRAGRDGVDPQYSGNGQTSASVPFVFTKWMRQTLEKAGYSPERLDNMTPEDGWKAINALPAADGLQWHERRRMIDLGYGETELRAMSTAQAHEVIKDNEVPARSASNGARF
jgi:hypothetical protein